MGRVEKNWPRGKCIESGSQSPMETSQGVTLAANRSGKLWLAVGIEAWFVIRVRQSFEYGDAANSRPT